MGNTDSKFVDVYRDFLVQLAATSHSTTGNDAQRTGTNLKLPESSETSETGGRRQSSKKNRDTALKGNNHNVIPLFSDTTSLSEIIAIYRDPSLLYPSDPDTLFQPFYRDFISLNDSLRGADSLGNLITNDDLRTVIHANYANYSNLIRFIILQIHLKLHTLGPTGHLEVNDNQITATTREFLMAQFNRILLLVRVLTKLIPIYYEYLGATNTREYHDDFLWDNSLDSVFNLSNFSTTISQDDGSNVNFVAPDGLLPLGSTLLNSLLDLLFIEGFTVPLRTEAELGGNRDTTTRNSGRVNGSSLGSINYGILWELGIDTPDQTLSQLQSPIFDSNRLEIVNLFLALFSSDIYYDKRSSTSNKFVLALTKKTSLVGTTTTTTINRTGNSIDDAYKLRQLLTSMVNLISVYCNNYKQQILTPYDTYNQKVSAQKSLPQLKSNLVVSCLQFINILLSVTETKTETSTSDRNFVTDYFGTFLRREFDSKLLLTAIVRVFKHPIEVAIEQESDPLRFNNSSVLSPSTRNTSGFIHSITSHSSQSDASGGRNNSNSNNNNNNNTNPNINSNPRSNTPNRMHTMSPSPLIGQRRRESNSNSNSNSNNNNNNNNNCNSNQTDNSGNIHSTTPNRNINSSANNGNNSSNNIGDSDQLPDVPVILNQVLLLLINLLKYNDGFLNYFSDKFSNKFLIFTIYYIKYYRNNPKASSTLIPLCYNISLFLTTKNLVLYKLLQTFTTNYYTNKLPNFYKILNVSNCNKLTYRDFSLIQLSSIAISDISNNVVPKPYVYELIYNILPINSGVINRSSEINISELSTRSNSNTSARSETSNNRSRKEEAAGISSNHNNIGNTVNMAPLSSSSTISDKLSYNAAVSLLNLLTKLSSKTYLSTPSDPLPGNISAHFDYLTSPATKLDLLALLLRATLITIVHYYKESKNLLFFLTRHQLILYQIKDALNFISKSVTGNGNDSNNGNNGNNNNNNGLSIQDYLFVQHLPVLDYSVPPTIYANHNASESSYYLNGINNNSGNAGSNLSISSPDLRNSSDDFGRCSSNTCGNDKNDNVSGTSANRYIFFNKPLPEYPDTESGSEDGPDAETCSNFESNTQLDDETELGDIQRVHTKRSTFSTTDSPNSSTLSLPESTMSSHVDDFTNLSTKKVRPPHASQHKLTKRKAGNEGFLFGSSFDVYSYSRTNMRTSEDSTSNNKLDQNSNGGNTKGDLAVNNDSNKNIEIYEHPDFPSLLLCDEENGASRHILVAIRPIWPIKLTERAKLKAPKCEPLSTIWTGSLALKLLIKMVRLIGSEFPDISRASNSADYVKMMREIDVYEDKFRTRVKYWLPVALQNHNSFAVSMPLGFSIQDEGNKVFNEWTYKILWSDTFAAHSTPYIKNSRRAALIGGLSAGSTTTRQTPYSRNTSLSSSVQGSPAVEKRVSSNPVTSRSISNGSLFATSSTNEDVPHSPTPVEISSGTRKFGALSHNRRSSGSSSSFFGFSWTGFSKGSNESQENIIKGEVEPTTIFPGGPNAVLVDPVLLKVNIWTSTRIKLFAIAVDEKEESSFFDMTSSLLKRLRFTSGGSSGSTNLRSSSSGNISASVGNGNDNNTRSNLTSISNVRPNSRMFSPTTNTNPYMHFGLSR